MSQHPSIISPLDLFLPGLPSQLAGFRIAHVSDLHVAYRRPRHHRIAEALRATPVDLAILTGDYMDRPGHEAVTMDVLREIVRDIRSRWGIVGVFGNHDTPKFRQLCQELPVHWLSDDVFLPPDLPLVVCGVASGHNWGGDSLALLAQWDAWSSGLGTPLTADAEAASLRPLRLMASHYPAYIPIASDMGMDLVLSGHTHGGQLRLPARRAIVNSSDLPTHLTSGVLRHRHTLCVVSRGLGESILPLRVFCPPHIPLYTLRQGPMQGLHSHHVENIHPW